MKPTDRPRGAAAGHAHHDPLYDDGLHNEDVAHEHSDINVRAVLIFAGGLAAVVFVCAVAMYGLFSLFERQAAANDPVVSPLARPAGLRPPEPRLLENEPENLRVFQQGQSEALKGIEAAKRQLLQQGLPVRAGASSEAWLGTRSPARGESSGGRAIPH